MPKKPVSVTLEADNLTWLKGRAMGGKYRSLSDALDDVVRAARVGGGPGEVRSVVGTLDIAASDPDLTSADAEIGALYAASLGRPVLLKETGPSSGPVKKASKRG